MKPTTRDGILRGGMATLIRLLLLGAFAISGYLLSVSLKGGTVAGCAPGSGCDVVLQSRWAYVFGIPVSALALVVDIALLATTFACGSRSTAKQRRGAWEIIAPGAILVLGSALWFTALQAVVLRQFCPWCLTAHALGATAAVLLLLRVPVAQAPREKDAAVPMAKIVRSGAIAVFAVALLGVAQTLAPGKTYSVAVVPASTTTAVTNTQTPSTASTTTTPPVAASIPFEIYGGRLKLDLAQAPVWGNVNAPRKMISLFDYTCSHCREMHERVVDVKKSFADKLAVISLPMPLDSQCNPLIRRTHPKQLNGCTYARIGLAVWRAKPEALLPYDDWFFATPTPPPLQMATNKAIELVGAEAFARASQDPIIESLIRTSINLFTINATEFRKDTMPQFVMGTNIYAGTPSLEVFRATVADFVR